jgi:hypothetical protein
VETTLVEAQANCYEARIKSLDKHAGLYRMKVRKKSLKKKSKERRPIPTYQVYNFTISL